jgi:hypothetical protein
MPDAVQTVAVCVSVFSVPENVIPARNCPFARMKKY